MLLRPERDLLERWDECVADAGTIAELKGRHMLVDNYAVLFEAVPVRAA